MKIPTLNNSMIAESAKPQAAKAGSRASFADLMRVSFEREAGGATTREEQVKNAANQLVSVAFIKPLMAQMHQSPFKTEMFSGGQGEAMFQEHLDTVLADRIAGRMNVSIADAIYRRIAGSGSLKGALGTSGINRQINQHG